MIDAGKLVIVPRSPWCRRSTAGKLTPGNSARRSSTWQAPGPSRGRTRADDRRRPVPRGSSRRASRSSCRGPRGADDRRREADAGQLGKVVIDLASAGTSPAAVPVVPTIDGGKLTPGNSARRSSTWQAPGPSRGRARADDRRRASWSSCRPWCRRSTAGGVLSPGKLVIDLASAGASPRPCPCRRAARGADVPRSSTWQRAAVPVVPTIDAGKRAESGQAGHRPGKRRGLSAAVPVPTIDAGQFQGEADGGQLGKLVIVPPVVAIHAT